MMQKTQRTNYKTFGKFNILKSADPAEIYLRVPQKELARANLVTANDYFRQFIQDRDLGGNIKSLVLRW